MLSWLQVDLRKEFQAQESVLQRTLGKLRAELQRAQEEARESRDKTNRLQTSLTNAEGTVKVDVCVSLGLCLCVFSSMCICLFYVCVFTSRSVCV